MKFQIVKYLIPILFLISCNTTPTENETQIEDASDTLNRIEIKFPGEGLNFSIHEIPEFDTIYYGVNNFDTIQCKNYNYCIYTKKVLKPLIAYNDELFIPNEFEGIIFKYHDKNCHEEIPSEYGLGQRVKYELPKKGNSYFKDYRNDLIFCEKFDTLDNKIWYSGSTFKGENYLDFTAVYQEGNLNLHTHICNSISKLQITK